MPTPAPRRRRSRSVKFVPADPTYRTAEELARVLGLPDQVDGEESGEAWQKWAEGLDDDGEPREGEC